MTFENYSPRQIPEKDYILDGAKDRPSRINRSLVLSPQMMEDHNWKLVRKYKTIERKETRYEEFMMDDAKLAVVAYGTAARIAKGAVKRARNDGMKVGLIRPISLWPFPSDIIRKRAGKTDLFFVFEMSTGQMVDDVRLALEGRSEVYFPREARRDHPDAGGGAADYLETVLPEGVGRMKKVYERPKLLKDVSMHYCPGCGHSIVTKLIAEVLEEMNLADRTICIPPGGVRRADV